MAEYRTFNPRDLGSTPRGRTKKQASVSHESHMRSPGSWELRVELARDPGTGKRRWKSRTVHGNEKQASRELARLVVEVGGLDVAEMSGGTVNDLGMRWLKHLAARGRERSTLYNYRLHLDAVAPHLGDLPVGAVTGSRRVIAI